MIRLLRHDDSIYREEDGAIRFEDLASTIDQGMGPPRAGQFGHTEKILYLRAIQGHSGSAFVDPSLQDNVLLPDDFIEHIYHVVNSHDLHSIIQSGLIPGSKSQEREASGVLHSRQSNVRRSGQRSRVRPEQSEDCSVQEYLENSPVSDTIQRNRLYNILHKSREDLPRLITPLGNKHCIWHVRQMPAVSGKKSTARIM